MGTTRQGLALLVLLLPCFAGVVRHTRASAGALISPLRARSARALRASGAQCRVETRAADAVGGAEGGLADLSAWRRGPNPFDLVRPDIEPLTASIKQLLRTDHVVLNRAAHHFFDTQTGKQFRPTIVLLMSRTVGQVEPPQGSEVARVVPPLASVPGVADQGVGEGLGVATVFQKQVHALSLAVGCAARCVRVRACACVWEYVRTRVRSCAEIG
jgi:hypothetical protein